MKSYSLMGFVAMLLLASMIGSARADLIVNGSFDNGMTGWTVPVGSAGPLDGTEPNPSPDGPSAYVNLITWLVNTPTAPLVAGQTYQVSFLARVLGAAGATNEADETIYTHVNSDANGVLAPYTVHLTNTWQRYSYQFTPTLPEAGGGYSVAFLNSAIYAGFGTGAGGWAQFGLDSVSLTAVPEPATCVLAICGVFGLLAYAWRRQK